MQVDIVIILDSDKYYIRCREKEAKAVREPCSGVFAIGPPDVDSVPAP
ncbi:MAG: hypothetical protein ACI957_005780, partial [Verrucomicrobiales bacterium]